MKKENGQMKWLLQESRGAGKYLFVQSIAGLVGQTILLIMASYVMVGVVNFLTGESHPPIMQMVWLSVALLIANLISRYLFDVYGAKVEQILWGNSRARIFKALYKRNFALLQKHHSSELQMLLNDDSSKTSVAFAFIATHVAADLFFGIGALVLMLRSNWQVAIIMVFVLSILAILFRLFMSLMQKTQSLKQKAEENVRLNLQEGVMKMLLLKAYSMANSFIDKHNKLYKIKLKASIGRARAVSLYNMTSGFMTFSIYFVVYGLGGYFVYIGNMTIGEMVGMATLSTFLSGPVFKFGMHTQTIATAAASAKRIRNITELPEEQQKAASSIGKLEEIHVNKVRFAYGEDEVLKGVSLQASLGDIVGIIGESGSGKSTLTKILMGFYEPSGGSVELRGKDGVAQDFLNYIAYVPSSDFIFSGSVIENICMSALEDKAAMEQAAKAAGIHDFIMSLPQGYDTIIGEGSNSLSSGQAQRIGIARALYTNKPILIFDEPTSNLDIEAISVLHASIKDAAHDKICIIVTHDLATRDICNKVYTIDNGVIAG